MIEFCKRTPGYEDVAEIYNQRESPNRRTVAALEAPTAVGYVYLLKHGSRREYKIGRTYNPLRRDGEIGIELPERAEPVHRIQTDDPSGIEKYWHDRFNGKRKNGEWFALTAQDVAAFRRWKKIY
jgi:hypothetical protein